MLAVSLLDSLLASDRLVEASTSRMRWAKWEAEHGGKLRGLKPGETHTLPHGTEVYRQKRLGGYVVDQTPINGRNPLDTAMKVAHGNEQAKAGRTPVEANLARRRQAGLSKPSNLDRDLARRGGSRPGGLTGKRKRSAPVPDMNQAVRNLARGHFVAHDDGAPLGSLLGS